MSNPGIHPDLEGLLARLLEQDLQPAEQEQLAQILQEDAASRLFYRKYLIVDALLRRENAPPIFKRGEEPGARGEENEERRAKSEEQSVGAAVELPYQLGDFAAGPSSFSPPIIIQSASPLLSPLPSFVGSVLFSYLMATLIVATGMLIAAAWKLPSYSEIVRQPWSAAERGQLASEPKMEPVGRITGMVDCRWETKGLGIRDWGLEEGSKSKVQGSKKIQSLIPNPQSLVSLGDKFTLASGLMEITYDTGARVILQGPVTYEVESAASGFLSVGKLTAKLEKKNGLPSPARGKGAGGEGDSNPQSLIPNPLFSVRTPTATVTDLGTEFGVEVSKEGHTISHVFRGAVRVQVVAADGQAERNAQVLHENESVRVERNSSKQGDNCVGVFVPASMPANFVREIPRRTIRTLDLVDAVAGGDGFSGRRNAGIDVTTGRSVQSLMSPSQENPNIILDGDRQYHRVKGLHFVDGVFIPDGSRGPLQTDSAGHSFAGFPPTTNTTSNHLWAGGVMHGPIDDQLKRPLTELVGTDYSAPGHGLLFMHANKAITFDLGAIRRANPDWRLLRFRAVAGDTEWIFQKGIMMYADLWVLVDGQSRFQRQKINGWKGAYWITLPIAERDRYLTLAATDAGDGIGWDWIIFGDPQLDMVHRGPEPQSMSAKEP